MFRTDLKGRKVQPSKATRCNLPRFFPGEELREGTEYEDMGIGWGGDTRKDKQEMLRPSPLLQASWDWPIGAVQNHSITATCHGA